MIDGHASLTYLGQVEEMETLSQHGLTKHALTIYEERKEDGSRIRSAAC